MDLDASTMTEELQRVNLLCYTECPEVACNKEEQLFVLAHLTAPEMPEGLPRCPVAVTAVIDRSGSMAGPKLDLVKSTLGFVVKNIKDEDQLGILSYDDFVQDNLPLSRMDAVGQERATAAVTAMVAGDNTNLSDGLLAGIDQLRGVPLTAYTQKAAIAQAERLSKIKRLPEGPFALPFVVTSFIQPEYRNLQGTTWTVSLELSSFAESLADIVESFSVELPAGMPNAGTLQTAARPPFEFIFQGCPRGGAADAPAAPTGLLGRVFGRAAQAPAPQRRERKARPTAEDDMAMAVDAAPEEAPAAPPRKEGQFSIFVTVRFTPRFGGGSHRLEHHLDLEQEMAATPAEVELTDLQPPAPAPVAAAADLQPRHTAFAQLERETQRLVRLRTLLLCWQRISHQSLANDLVEEIFEFMRTMLISSVWLFTDGLANKGIVETAAIKTEEERKLASMKDPCSVFTFGFGTDHDPNMLRAISDAGNGMYYFIDKEESIPNSFTDCLGGLISVVAKDIKLQITVNHGLCSIAKVMTKYQSSVEPDGQRAVVSMRDLYSEEGRDIVVLLNFRNQERPSDAGTPCLTWQLSYYNVLNKRQEVTTAFSSVARPDVVDPTRRDPPPELDRQRNRVACAEAMEQSRLLADQGNLAEARRVLTACIETVTHSKTAEDPFCRALIEDVEQCFAQLRSREHYYAMGQKRMQNVESTHAMQRSCGHKAWYTNKSKVAMTSKYWSEQNEEE